jgi:hypothetical protein
VGSLTSHNPIGLQGLLWGQLYFYFSELADSNGLMVYDSIIITAATTTTTSSSSIIIGRTAFSES